MVPKPTIVAADEREAMRRRLPSALVIFVFSSATGLYFASQVAFFWPEDVQVPWRIALPKNLLYYWAWGALVPVVVMLGHRFPLGSGWKLPNIGVHILAACVLTAIQIAIPALVLNWLGIYHAEPTLLFMNERVSNNFHSSFPTYWLILFVVLTLEYGAKDQKREVRATRLERQLAEARLEALRMQLNPHFLFNTLNSISSVMYTDPDAADTMIRKLGELLRLSLNENRVQEITLREELEFVQRYVDIERVRFEERLEVRLHVDEDTLEALVPTLVLQPVMENALRHAIAPRTSGGRVTVVAKRDRGWLRLSVSDDGPGVPDGRVAEGVGLANTRARLEQLYGSSGVLRFVSPTPGGGLRVEMTMPFQIRSTLTVNRDATPLAAQVS